jgi:hypothetical protein
VYESGSLGIVSNATPASFSVSAFAGTGDLGSFASTAAFSIGATDAVSSIGLISSTEVATFSIEGFAASSYSSVLLNVLSDANPASFSISAVDAVSSLGSSSSAQPTDFLISSSDHWSLLGTMPVLVRCILVQLTQISCIFLGICI